MELLHRIITSIGGTRFLDYAALQKLLRRLVFDPAMPGAMQMQLSGNLLSRFLTRDVLSVHYPIYKASLTPPSPAARARRSLKPALAIGSLVPTPLAICAETGERRSQRLRRAPKQRPCGRVQVSEGGASIERRRPSLGRDPPDDELPGRGTPNDRLVAASPRVLESKKQMCRTADEGQRRQAPRLMSWNRNALRSDRMAQSARFGDKAALTWMMANVQAPRCPSCIPTG